MTERLTKREKNGLAYFPMCFTPPCNGEGCKDENCIFISDVCEQLAEYEELEEQGRLLQLMCKVGDTVYVDAAIYLGDMDSEQLNDISNFIPACRQCNLYKSTFELEEFRYRLAVKYGLIEEKKRPIVFCFEKNGGKL